MQVAVGYQPRPGLGPAAARLGQVEKYVDPRQWVMKIVQIPLNCEGRIIGKGGVEINRMRNESKANIQVKHEDGDTLATVCIKGTPAQIEHAEVLIFECIKAGRPKEWEQRTLEVPSDCIGEAIGKAGRNLQEMCERSECKIKFINANELDAYAQAGMQLCVIRGPPDKIDFAATLMSERIAGVQAQRYDNTYTKKRDNAKIQENRERFVTNHAQPGPAFHPTWEPASQTAILSARERFLQKQGK